MGYITFENVSKTYPNGTLALHDISFSIGEGEFVFLIGESGAGKSTVFRLLTREENPTAGRVSVEGFDLAQLEDRRIPYLRRKIGMIFQDFRLIDTLTVGENVALAMEMIGESPKKIKQRVPLVLSIVGLRRKMSHYPTQLSGGEQQRVCIARSLVNKPRLIIADEPTGDLDPVNGEAIMALLERINRENGTTVITCTHDRDIVDRMNRRVIEICDGVLVRDDAEGLYILESERRNNRFAQETCALDREEQARIIHEELEEGRDALRQFRDENGDRIDRRAQKMRDTVKRDDFYTELRKNVSARRSRQTDEETLSRTGRVPVIRLKESEDNES
ncbi:MAG: cell division ATP-binding protein FtsE [Clostridiaceae bacterium]|jgi:cell division ATP-binding protein FtsE|nr:cell division ATP-binding protein FtsE [Clostridiaceae bacterium]